MPLGLGRQDIGYALQCRCKEELSFGLEGLGPRSNVGAVSMSRGRRGRERMGFRVRREGLVGDLRGFVGRKMELTELDQAAESGLAGLMPILWLLG